MFYKILKNNIYIYMSSQNIYLDLKNKQKGGSRFIKLGSKILPQAVVVATGLKIGLTDKPDMTVPPSSPASLASLAFSPASTLSTKINEVGKKIEDNISKMTDQTQLFVPNLLTNAIMNDDLSEVEKLIKEFKFDLNLNFNTLDAKGYTPLTLAALNGNIEIVQLLVESGADINRPNAKGYTRSEEHTSELQSR